MNIRSRRRRKKGTRKTCIKRMIKSYIKIDGEIPDRIKKSIQEKREWMTTVKSIQPKYLKLITEQELKESRTQCYEYLL